MPPTPSQRTSVTRSNVSFTEKGSAEEDTLEAHSVDRARILRKLDWYVLRDVFNDRL